MQLYTFARTAFWVSLGGVLMHAALGVETVGYAFEYLMCASVAAMLFTHPGWSQRR